MSQLLRLKCKTCGEEFVSGIQLDPASFSSAVLANNVESCPRGDSNSYDKADYYFK